MRLGYRLLEEHVDQRTGARLLVARSGDPGELVFCELRAERIGDQDRPPDSLHRRRMDEALRAAGIRYTLHWSKNSGIDPEKLDYMYGAQKIASWKAARRAVFGDDATLMRLFEHDAMVQAGLA